MNELAFQRQANPELRELALFAGAGGGILASKLLGWRTVCAVEINSFCARRLMQRQNEGHIPPFPIWDDVCTFDGREWAGIVDVVSGGFPCQDISAAGKGAGIDGERSGLWREVVRIVSEVRPRYVFVENSPMLTSRGLGRVLGNLAELGFDAKWGVLGAGHLGGWHLRERIWVVATDPGQKRIQGSAQSQIQRKLGIPWRKDVRRLEDLQGRSDIPEPLVRRISDGLASGVDRLSAIGNGQVPIVAATAWRELMGMPADWLDGVTPD